jgi:hypothetical protein
MQADRERGNSISPRFISSWVIPKFTSKIKLFKLNQLKNTNKNSLGHIYTIKDKGAA